MQHGAYYDDISNFHALHQAMAPDAVKAEYELDYAGEQTGLLPNATIKHVAKPSAISRLLRWCLAVLVLAGVLSIVSYKEFPSTTVIDDLPEISVAFIGNSMMVRAASSMLKRIFIFTPFDVDFFHFSFSITTIFHVW